MLPARNRQLRTRSEGWPRPSLSPSRFPRFPPSSSDTSRELGVRPCSSAWEISGPATG